MHHRLLITGEVITEALRLLQRLTDARYVAVSEDTPDAGKERQFFPVALDILVLQKRDERLGCG